LSNWELVRVLQNGEERSYRFPGQFQLKPGRSVTVSFQTVTVKIKINVFPIFSLKRSGPTTKVARVTLPIVWSMKMLTIGA